MVMLAKGNRSKAVTKACKTHGGFYLGSIGGARWAARLGCVARCCRWLCVARCCRCLCVAGLRLSVSRLGCVAGCRGWAVSLDCYAGLRRWVPWLVAEAPRCVAVTALSCRH
jgi:hypothetical protein